MSLSFDIDKGALDKALRMLELTGANMEKAVPRIISDATTLVYRKVRGIIRRENIHKTGLYEKSTRMQVTDRGRESFGIVGNAAKDARTGFPYPVVIEEGSKPHTITPTVKKCLHFYTRGGEEVFTRKVNHPGTKPKHVFRRARDYAFKELPKLVDGFLKKVGKL